MNLSLRTRGYTRNGNIYYRDNVYSGTRGASLWETAPMLAALSDPGYYFLFQDDFRTFNTVATTGSYAIVEDGTPAQLQIDAANGVLSIATDVNDNDEAYVSTITETWKFAASKPMWFEARVALTEAATDKANIIVGLSDTVAANSLLDNGAGPMASYDGAVWFKVDGGTVWQFESSNAGTQVTTSSAGAFVTNTWYRLGFIFDPSDGTTGIITPYLDGVIGTAQNITLSGLEEMHALLGVKAGSAAAETLRVDYIQILAVR